MNIYIRILLYHWSYIDRKIPLPKGREVVEDRAPTKEELRKIMMHSSTKMKALIALAASSGLRIGTILNLKVGDIDFETDPDILVIRVRPEISKTRIGYFSLASKEAREYLEAYLEYRRKMGEKITKDSPLFRKKGGGLLTYEAVHKAFKIALIKAGIEERARWKNWWKIHIHTLRKFFRSQLEGSLTRSERERLMGHVAKEYLDGAYFRPIEKELIMKYKAAMHRLTIFREEEKDKEIFIKQMEIQLRLQGYPEDRIRRILDILRRAKRL